MFDWLTRFRWIVTHADRGRWHGNRGYPKSQHGIALPLYAAPNGDAAPGLVHLNANPEAHHG